MAYLYVKSGGTATGTAGRYTSPKTGSWSAAFSAVSEYYGNLFTIFTATNSQGETILQENDTILVSNVHYYLYDQNIIWTKINLSTTVKGISIISIDDSDLTLPLYGAKEKDQLIYTSYYDNYSFYISVDYVYGVIFEVTNATGLFFNDTSQGRDYPYSMILENCRFIALESSTFNGYIQSYYSTTFLNCVFDFGLTNIGNTYRRLFYLYSHGGAKIFRNCEFIASTKSDSVMNVYNAEYYTSIAEFDGCDFSQCNRPLFVANSGTVAGFLNQLSVSRCLEHTNSRINIYKPSYEYSYEYSYDTNKYLRDIQYYLQSIVTNTVIIYRTTGAEYLNAQFFSYSIQTIDYTAPYQIPFIFKLCEFYLDTSTTKTFTVQLARDNGATGLTNSDIGIILYHSDDSTSKPNRKSTLKVCPVNSSTLPTSSESWIGLTNPTKQYLSVTTSDTGSYGLCSVYLDIRVRNTTFYVCPKVDIT